MSEETRILIVDDDPDIRNILNLLLRREYDTAEAANGRAAVAYMENCGIENGFTQERTSAREEYTPPFDLTGV